MLFRVLLCTVLAFPLLPDSLRACNIPVFRYALERWKPDPFEITILHRGPLSAEDRTNVCALEKFGLDGDGYGNYHVETLDLQQLSAALVQGLNPGRPTVLLDPAIRAWLGQDRQSEPVLVVRSPDVPSDAPPTWITRFSSEFARALMASPVRREIVRRVLDGESGIWILLESGDKDADDRAAALLQKELTRHERELKLPEGIGVPGSTLFSELPLRIKFSIIRLRRDDPAEQLLMHTLLGSEPDLQDRTEPMVFPVFGRGRCLWGMIGKGINRNVIASSAEYLIDRCSCEKKRANPGFELLLAADWGTILEGGKADEPPLPEMLGSLRTPHEPDDAVESKSPTVEPTDGARTSHNDRPGFSKFLATLLPLLAGGAVLLVLGTIFIMLRGKANGRS